MTHLTRTLLLVTLAGCPGDDDGGGGGGSGVNPADPCLPKMSLNGELVDWDSGASGFMGVPGATVVIETDTAGASVTAPNGRFELCIDPEADWAEVFPASASPYVGGRIVVSPNVLRELPTLSFRTFTTTRAADFGFDTAKAHVFVHVLGAARTVQMSSAFTAEVMQTFDGTAWAAGNTGTDIYLGNIPASMGSGSIVVSGGEWQGPTTIPIEAGRFTFVTLEAQ